MTKHLVATALLAASLCVGTASATSGASEANGTVVDREGNPLVDVVVKFTPASQPTTTYDGKTNKKGRYFVPGLFNPQGDQWIVDIEATGYLPVSMEVESRSVNRVLIGDVFTGQIPPGTAIPQVTIRPLGTARIDFTLAPRDEVMAPRVSEGDAGKVEAGSPGVPQRDPWDAALALAAAGDLEGSIAPLERSIKDEPEDAQRHATLAKILYRLERFEPATLAATRAVELAPQDLDVRLVLFSVHVTAGKFEQAREVLEAAPAEQLQDPRLLRQLAFVLIEIGDRPAAIGTYEKVVAAQPDDAESWLALADLYAASGQSEKSSAAYEKVTELDPDGAHQVFFNLGALLMNKDERSEAETRKMINAFRKAIELKADYGAAHKQLGLALLGTGDRAGARSELEAYVRLDPHAPDAKQLEQLIKSLQ